MTCFEVSVVMLSKLASLSPAWFCIFPFFFANWQWKMKRSFSSIKALAWKLAVTQQTLICLLIPHILMDWGIIWWTSCALSLSTVDLFFPLSLRRNSTWKFNESTVWEAGIATSEAVRVALAPETEVFFFFSVWVLKWRFDPRSPSPQKLCLPQYEKEKLLGDFTMGSKKRLHDVIFFHRFSLCLFPRVETKTLPDSVWSARG